MGVVVGGAAKNEGLPTPKATVSTSLRTTLQPFLAFDRKAVSPTGTPPSVIQMVITKNLTLAQAWGILNLARTQNGTTNVTAFPFFATPEFYTLGFSWEVSKLVANTSVVNGGNWSVAPPPPPTNLWALFWNTIAGFAAYVWNAAVAVGQFFVNVGKWLVQAFISVVKGLTTGDWNDFKNQVLKPLIEALQKFINWLLDLLRTVVNVLFGPIIDAIRGAMISFAQTIAYGLETARRQWLATGSPGTIAPGVIASTLFGSYYQALLLVGIVIVVVLTIATPFLAVAGFILGFVISLVLDFVLSHAFAGKPNAPGVSGPVGLLGLSNVLSTIVGFMQAFVSDSKDPLPGSNSATPGVRSPVPKRPLSNIPPEHAFWWGLGSSVLSMGSLFASVFSLALADKTGKASSAISLAGSLLSFTMSLAFTLVAGFAEDRYGLAVLSTIFSGISLFTSGYSLSKSSFKTLDVLVLSAISTALSFGSLAISLWTLF